MTGKSFVLKVAEGGGKPETLEVAKNQLLVCKHCQVIVEAT